MGAQQQPRCITPGPLGMRGRRSYAAWKERVVYARPPREGPSSAEETRNGTPCPHVPASLLSGRGCWEKPAGSVYVGSRPGHRMRGEWSELCGAGVGGEEAGPTSRPPQQHLRGLTFTFTTLSRWSLSGCTTCGVGPASPTIHVSLRCLSQNPPLPTLVIY